MFVSFLGYFCTIRPLKNRIKRADATKIVLQLPCADMLRQLEGGNGTSTRIEGKKKLVRKSFDINLSLCFFKGGQSKKEVKAFLQDKARKISLHLRICLHFSCHCLARAGRCLFLRSRLPRREDGFISLVFCDQEGPNLAREKGVISH